jgi:hypothetical protein
MAVNGKVLAVVLITLLFIFFVWRPKCLMGSSSYLFTQAGGQEYYTNEGGEQGFGNSMLNESNFGDFSGNGGLSTSLLPREIPSQEDFGAFSPNDILKGQNYLDARSQIGYPETLGGVLRNASLDVRSEPPNPQNPVSIFNNTTIVPDLMRPQFEIGR